MPPETSFLDVARCCSSSHIITALCWIIPQGCPHSLPHAPPRMPNFYSASSKPCRFRLSVPSAAGWRTVLSRSIPLSLGVWHFTLRFVFPKVGLATPVDLERRAVAYLTRSLLSRLNRRQVGSHFCAFAGVRKDCVQRTTNETKRAREGGRERAKKYRQTDRRTEREGGREKLLLLSAPFRFPSVINLPMMIDMSSLMSACCKMS